MENHTIILTTPIVEIPDTNIIEFVQNLIIRNLMTVDYFGGELDNHADYTDKIQSSTINLTIHFEQDDIDYNLFEEKILNLALQLITTKKVQQIIVDKDVDEVEIYLS